MKQKIFIWLDDNIFWTSGVIIWLYDSISVIISLNGSFNVIIWLDYNILLNIFVLPG
jgi:hypothetical protein